MRRLLLLACFVLSGCGLLGDDVGKFDKQVTPIIEKLGGQLGNQTHDLTVRTVESILSGPASGERRRLKITTYIELETIKESTE